jgi:putative transposase
VRPEYRDLHSQVLQDVLRRLDRAFHAFFRRVQAGETPGYPRFQGSNRSTSFTSKQCGNGARLENGYLVLSKIGRLAVRWSRPSEGPPRRSPAPGRRTAGMPAARVLSTAPRK